MRLFGQIKASLARDSLQKELYESLSYIKNVVILGRGEHMSGELMLSELSELGGRLSKSFEDMAFALHVNDREKAETVLFTVFGDGFSKDLGRFLAGWEDIPPSELAQTVEIYRSALREEREERLEKRDELVSDLIYFPVVLNSMLVLLNFVYVAFFIEQQSALQFLF